MMDCASGNAGDAKAGQENDGKLLLQLGRLFLASKQPQKAVKAYERFCEQYPLDARGPYNLAVALQQMGDLQQAAEQLRKCISMEGGVAGDEAYEALSGVLLKLKLFEEAVLLCEERAVVRPSPVLFYNLNTAMRQCGRMQEAIQRTCHALGLEPNCAAGGVATRSHSQTTSSGPSTEYTVVCVKYGTKYDARYVNTLHDSLRRNSCLRWRFVCFTDDPSGLGSAIDTRPLPSLNWQGWWYKAYLFAEDTGLSGRIVYIDLDTVINANIDTIFEFEGRFGVLGCQMMSNENYRQGINTSVMVWTAGDLQGIYDFLPAQYDVIVQLLHKFDHWVECVALSASTAMNMPQLVPKMEGFFIEYAHYCTAGEENGSEDDDLAVQPLPPTAAVVCFPLAPKPHHLIDKVSWVAEKWRENTMKQEGTSQR